MNVIGIDPGLGGALSLFFHGELNDLIDMPTVKIVRGKSTKRQIDLPVLAERLQAWSLVFPHAWMERVAAMPGQGVSSMFQFGRSVGQVEAVLAAFKTPISYVAPQAWQKAVGMSKGPDASRHRASQLMPRDAHRWPLKLHHGRADAALIGWYGVRAGLQLGGSPARSGEDQAGVPGTISTDVST